VSALILLQLNCGDANAGGGASPWSSGAHHKVRLISGVYKSPSGREQILVGVHIKLEKGWKTYWRFPGDSGVPPQFDWQDSNNLKDSKILWPAPQRFKDPYSTTIGYKDEIVFPVAVSPRSAGQPIDLNVKLEFGVCQDICIFAVANLDLSVSEDDARQSIYNILLNRFVSKVPEVIHPTASSTHSIRSVSAVLDGDKPHIIVEARYPEDARKRDLFIEGPNDFYIPIPSLTKQISTNLDEYRVDLKGGDDPKLLNGKVLTFTMVSTDGQVEIKRQLN
jgi:DsbC/DsbD-like thiol-disulfide interchange protein